MGLTGHRTRSEQPLVCAIILNWNRPDDTIECLTSLLPVMRRHRLAVVVCDNASSDQSAHRLQEWAGRHFELTGLDARVSDGALASGWDFLLVQTGANRGYAGGNNVGIRYILERECCDLIWVLNNDTVVDEHALSALLECANRYPDVGIFGSTLVHYHRPSVVQSAGGCRYHPATTIMRNIWGGRSLNNVLREHGGDIHLDYVSGASMFCRAELFRQVGLLDERFFLYYEEIDLARRAHAIGYSLRWCKDAIVYHKGAVSTGGRSPTNPQESWRSNYHENLSTLLYTMKHHPRIVPLAASLRFLAKSLVYVMHGRLQLFSALVSAYRDAFTGSQSAMSVKGQEATPLAIGFSALSRGGDQAYAPCRRDGTGCARESE
jgi:GT2 family glycosyltransferase